MELTQVRYFVTLCRTLNFTRAAELCNVTQPAFSRAVQKLEAELGGALLFRERNLTQLTELGRSVRPHLEAMLDAADAARALAAAKATRMTASLKIGLGPGIGAASVAAAVREVAAALPDVAIHFDEAGPAVLVEEIPDRLNRWPLYTDRAVAVLPPGHGLLGLNAVAAENILDQTVLVGDFCGGFAGRLAAGGFSLRVQKCTGGVSQILDLVAAGLGVALLSDRLRLAPPLASRPFVEPELPRNVLLTVVAGRPLNPAAASFVKLCRAARPG
jgi:DNA-binding transcriptional LysR family regulator